MIRIQVTLRDVYGETKIYPANLAAKSLAAIAGTKTLTTHTIVNALNMGIEVEFVGNEGVVYTRAAQFLAR